jgi:hypothetical protein
MAGDDLFRKALLRGGQHEKRHCGGASSAEAKSHCRTAPPLKARQKRMLREAEGRLRQSRVKRSEHAFAYCVRCRLVGHFAQQFLRSRQVKLGCLADRALRTMDLPSCGLRGVQLAIEFRLRQKDHFAPVCHNDPFQPLLTAICVSIRCARHDRILRYVLCSLGIAHEPTGEVVGGIAVRQDHCLE